ncbi:MAG: AraC family transcriptional regulator [Tepidisphaeraceae bacterium]
MPRKSKAIPISASPIIRARAQPGEATADPSLSYLTQVKDARPPLSERSPIWIRHGSVREGLACPTPERHPCCEFGIQLSGRGIELVGAEKAQRRRGSIFLAGPGLPHWIEITEYPVDFITVFFLPSLLIDSGPENDGLTILRRFTMAHSIGRRVLHPTPAVAARLESGFRQMVEEWTSPRFGREVRLRILLLDMLVTLMRWEEQSATSRAGGKGSTALANTSTAAKAERASRGKPAEASADAEGEAASASMWRQVHRALEYLRDHFADPVYADDVAAAAGVSRSRLQAVFRATLGMSWGQYLRGYRIHQAAALLSSADCGVLDAAIAVGFETPSHFNATFRALMGVSPREYRRRSRGGDGDTG